MQVSVEKTSGLERKLTVQVPAETIDKEVNDRIQDLAKKVKLDGFRPGKVPLKVIKQRFSTGVRQEVANEMMRSTLYDAMKEKDLVPAGAPQVEPGQIKDGEDFEYTAVFEVLPSIEIAELDGEKVESVSATVTDEDIDAMVQKLREQHLDWVEADRQSKDGDKLVIDFEGFIDGTPFDGGKANDFELQLGSGSMIPGFESGLEGLAKGDEKDLQVTFPEEYGHKDLAGKEAVFKVKVHKVSESQLPELTDEFIAKYDVKEGGVEAFMADVRKNMEKELERQVKQLNKERVFDAFLNKNPCDLPKALTDKEVENLKQEMINRVFGDRQVDKSKVPDLPSEMFQEQAKRRVHLGLLFSDYIKRHELKPDQQKIDDFLEKMASSYDKPEEVISYYRGSRERMADVEASVLEEQVVEKMLENVEKVEKAMTYEEVMNPKPEAQSKDDNQGEDNE